MSTWFLNDPQDAKLVLGVHFEANSASFLANLQSFLFFIINLYFWNPKTVATLLTKARTTEFTWTADSFEKFQNAIFFKISKNPSVG